MHPRLGLVTLATAALAACHPGGCGAPWPGSDAGTPLADAGTDLSDAGTPDAGTGTGTSTGTVGGGEFEPHDAQWVTFSFGAWQVPQVLVTTETGLCADFQAGSARQRSRTLTLAFLASPGDGTGTLPLTPATYVIDPVTGYFCLGSHDCSLQAVADLVTLGDGCALVDDVLADSGSITVDSVGNDGVTGRFSLQFGEDRLQGSFAAPRCAASSGGTGGDCQ